MLRKKTEMWFQTAKKVFSWLLQMRSASVVFSGSSAGFFNGSKTALSFPSAIATRLFFGLDLRKESLIYTDDLREKQTNLREKAVRVRDFSRQFKKV